MGRYMSKCKRIGEVTIMELSDVVDTDIPATTKKRKFTFSGGTPSGILVSPAVSSSSDEQAGSSTSCCSRNGSSYSKSPDLDENGVEVTQKEKMSSSNERQEESEEPESKKMPQNESVRRRISEKIPSKDELEAFFTRREKDRLKRFREKYNFDFEKEEPLEGRYKWVQIYEN